MFDDGMTEDDLNTICECKSVFRDRLSSLDGKVTGRYIAGGTPWSVQDVKYDIALPCATQNEINEEGAKILVANGVLAVAEGANLPTTLEGQDILRAKTDLIYLPAKAANAGGVGVSGFEMSQNAQRLTWSPEEVDQRLQNMMANIYGQMEENAGPGGTLEQGANRAGFVKVATAMKELGWVF